MLTTHNLVDEKMPKREAINSLEGRHYLKHAKYPLDLRQKLTKSYSSRNKKIQTIRISHSLLSLTERLIKNFSGKRPASCYC